MERYADMSQLTVFSCNVAGCKVQADSGIRMLLPNGWIGFRLDAELMVNTESNQDDLRSRRIVPLMAPRDNLQHVCPKHAAEIQLRIEGLLCDYGKKGQVK
jgi:hypothetical protein